MKINPEIFREYDVRGIYPSMVNAEVIGKISTAFAQLLKQKYSKKKKIVIVVGRDIRKSSNLLQKRFMESIAENGINIIDLGQITTPMLYFAVNILKTDGGAVITASHNPLKYNGVKLATKKAEPVGGYEIKKFVTARETKQQKRVQVGSVTKKNIEKKYYNAVYKNFAGGKKIRVDHSFDYDADRLIIYGKNKKPIRGDIIGGIIGGIAAKKGDTIVYDLISSRAVPEFFRNKGIKAVPCRVGEFNMKNLMIQKRAVFGMEMSGHYYFKKFNYCESPDFGLRKIKDEIHKTGRSLAELIAPFEKYHHSGVINLKISKRSDFEKIVKKLKKEYINGAVNFADGLTVEFSGWWFNIRQSHTEPVVRLVVEATSKQTMNRKKKEIMELIK